MTRLGRGFARVVETVIASVGIASLLMVGLASPAWAVSDGWSPPTDLASGLNDMYSPGPQIVFGPDGTAIAVWVLKLGTEFTVQSRTSQDNGTTWSSTVNLSTAGGHAQAPQISIDSTGRAIAVWSCFDGTEHVIQSSASGDGGLSWSTPVNISLAGQSALSPQVSSDASGTTIATWIRSDGINDIVQTSTSSDGGALWSTPVSISVTGFSAINPRIAFGAVGSAIVTWFRYDGSDLIVQASSSSNGGVSWSSPVDLSVAGLDSSYPQISTTPDGHAIVIWSSYDGVDLITTSSTSSDNGATWSPPASLSSPGASSFSPHVTMDGSGTAIALWSRVVLPDVTVQSASSSDSGATWTSPTDVSAVGTDGSDPQVILGDDGTAIAVWSFNSGGGNVIQTSSSSNRGATWSSPVDLSTTAGSSFVPQVAFDSGGNAISIWSLYDDFNNDIIQTSSYTYPVLPNTGRDVGSATSAALTGAMSLLACGLLVLVLVRRNTRRRSL